MTLTGKHYAQATTQGVVQGGPSSRIQSGPARAPAPAATAAGAEDSLLWAACCAYVTYPCAL